MQIVIKIDENLYTRLFDNGQIDAVDMLKVCSAVRKGNILPERHERLIDADELMEHVWRDKLDSRELIAQMIENAPTIKEIPTKIPIHIYERLLELVEQKNN